MSGARRHPSERSQECVDHLAMATDEEEDGDRQHFEDLREQGRRRVEGGVRDVGERHAAGLTDDLASELHAGKEDEDCKTEGESENGFAGKQSSQNDQVLRLRNWLSPKQRSQNERNGNGE